MNGHRYTKEERAFFQEYVPGHSYSDIQKEFIKLFKWEITISQIKSYIGNNKLSTGRNGQFQKGNIPYNKGMKGIASPGSEKGWFKKGNIPINHRKIGSERITKDGYVEVKVDEPNVWKLKHRVVWQQHYGVIPKGKIIIFRDNDKTNCDIDNLILISRAQNAILNKNGLYAYKDEYKETVVLLAELKCKTSKVKKGEK